MANFAQPTNAKVRRNVTGIVVNGRTHDVDVDGALAATDTIETVTIPENAYLMEVGFVASATITGGVDIGTTTDDDRFGAAITATANTVGKGDLDPAVQLTGADTLIRFTANGTLGAGETLKMWASYTMDFES